MSTDNHIIAQFQGVNATLREINSSIVETNKSVGRVEGVQKSQWNAIKRLEAKLENVTCATNDDLYGLKEITGKLETKVGLLKAKKQSRYPAPGSPTKSAGIPWKDIFTTGNVRLILLILLLIASAIAGVTIPLNLLSW